jgi:hypothetical protein
MLPPAVYRPVKIVLPAPEKRKELMSQKTTCGPDGDTGQAPIKIRGKQAQDEQRKQGGEIAASSRSFDKLRMSGTPRNDSAFDTFLYPCYH